MSSIANERRRKEGLALLERALKSLGWSWALIDQGQDLSGPVTGMLIGTGDFLSNFSDLEIAP